MSRRYRNARTGRRGVERGPVIRPPAEMPIWAWLLAVYAPYMRGILWALIFGAALLASLLGT